MDDINNERQKEQISGKIAKEGDDEMSVVIERPNTPLQSIEKSLKEVKEFTLGEKTMKTLDESKELWSKWIKESDSK